MSFYLDDVTESFHRCRNDEAFIKNFYEIFLAKSPEIAAKFAVTDFELQEIMFRESLLMVLAFHLSMPGTREDIVRLGTRHRALGVRPEDYAVWLDSLCEAIKRHDPKFSDELDGKWREAMQEPIALMSTAD